MSPGNPAPASNASSTPMRTFSRTLLKAAYHLLAVVVVLRGGWFLYSYFSSYFSPDFLVEARASAGLTTTLGFIRGINPFAAEHVETYGNLYSAVWPGLNALVAMAVGATGYQDVRHVMFVVSAFTVTATALGIVVTALRGKIDLLLAICAGFAFILFCTTKNSMGEFSYAPGIALSVFALALTVNRTDRIGLFWSLLLITFASLFKIYFALLVIPIITAYLASVKTKQLLPTLLAWAALSSAIYLLLIATLPLYFDCLFNVQIKYVSRHYDRILPNLIWFITVFPFVFVLFVPKVVEIFVLRSDNRRRNLLFASGCFIVFVFVVAVMLPHGGNFGTYMIHLLGPIFISLLLVNVGDRQKSADPIAGMTAVVVLLVTVLSPVSSEDSWKVYGILSQQDLDENRRILADIDVLLDQYEPEDIYVDFSLASAAIRSNLPFVDNGNRQYISPYLAGRLKGTIRLNPILELISWKPKRFAGGVSPAAKLLASKLIICGYQCPKGTGHILVKQLGSLAFSYGQSPTIKVFALPSI